MQQFELFDNLDSFEKEKSRKDDNQFGNQVWKFKRSVLFIIYSLVLLIAGFVLGVERGKNIAALGVKDDPTVKQVVSLPAKTESKKTLSINKQKPVKQEKAEKVPALKQSTAEFGKVYIIQVASYKNLDTATKVKDALKKQGFLAYVVNSKPYIKVYVGPHKSRIETEEKLKVLKKQYPDSFIR